MYIPGGKTRKQISTYSGKCCKGNKWRDELGVPEDGHLRWKRQGRLGLLAENGTSHAKSWRKNVPSRWNSKGTGWEGRRGLPIDEQKGYPGMSWTNRQLFWGEVGRSPEFKASYATIRMLGLILRAKEISGCLKQGVTKSGVLVIKRSFWAHYGNKPI